MTHECPVTDCPEQVRVDMLMCAPHWRMAPGAIKGAVWNAWRDGAGAGTVQHAAAIAAAIRSVNERLARGTA